MSIRNKDGSIFKPGLSNNVVLEPVCKNLPIIKEKEEEEEKLELEDIKEFIQEPINKLIGWCLPAEVFEEDSLYGSKKSIRFREKFSTELILRERSGLSCVFWAPIKKLEYGSIVYLWDEREWWKVNDTKEEGDGIVITCRPSDQTPSF